MEDLDARADLGKYNQDFQGLLGKHRNMKPTWPSSQFFGTSPLLSKYGRRNWKKKLSLKDQMQSMVVFLKESLVN